MTELITRQASARVRARINGAAPPGAEGHLELRPWLRMLSCSMKMENIVSHRLRKEFNISMARFDVMSRLERFPDGLTMSGLSRRLIVSNGAITGLGELSSEAHSDLMRNLTELQRNLDPHVRAEA